PKTLIKGNFNSVTNELNLTGTSTKLTFADFVAKNWNIDAKTDMGLQVSMGCENLYLSDSTWLRDFNLVTSTDSDSVNLALTWDNKSKNENKGDIKAFLHFNPNSIIELKILPSQFVLSDSIWKITKVNEVVIDSSFITIKQLIVENASQSIALNGIVSNNKTDELKLSLTNFNLANLNLFTKTSGLNFNGRINGESVLTDVFHELLFLSNNNFTSLSINDNAMGDGTIKTVWDNAKEALYMHGSFTVGIVPNILFSGYYYPKQTENNLDMKLDLQAIQLQLFEPFVKDYCPNFKGFFAGNIEIKGSVTEPKVSGILHVNAKKITVGYLNTTYNFSHDIIIDNNSFGVENLNIFDINHNKAVATGKVYHNNFKNFQLDFDIHPQKFMCLNTTEANNSLYYGKAYVSGVINISGYTDNIAIAANVKTESIVSNDKPDKLNMLSKTELTKFYIPLSGPGELSSNDFITFIKKDSSLDLKNDYKVQLGGLTLNFDLEVTPDAEVQLIFDQKVGDIIRSRGNGNINLEITTKGDFKMYGDYVIEGGDYLFTLKNIINKKFDLEKGGVIKWSGIPYKADINLSTVYKARASLKPFFPDDSSSTLKKRYPVDLKLLMTGDLLSPEINFNIGLPTVDATISQTVLNYIQANCSPTSSAIC
ncbi:MAG: translocation/assembly module TamB, partial [Bacteroidetes bacterium]|nr:translocation/assembly module TamB [Bacteroidota bacterium]